MARRGKRRPGFDPNAGMGGMMEQVQQMQADIAAAQEEAQSEIIEVSAGGGAVKITITGAQEVQAIDIDPAIIDPEDEEWLEDLELLLLAAFNQAVEQSKEMVAERVKEAAGPLAGMMGDMGMGDLGGLLGGM